MFPHIKGEMVCDMTNKRQTNTDLALIIDVSEATAKIQFDNCGYQTRWNNEPSLILFRFTLH
jgi:hypothetical protein